MKIIFICTNYSSYNDGIGHYVHNLVNEIKKSNLADVDIVSGNTLKYKGINKLKSKVMINAIDEYLSKNKSISKDSYFIIEYPFLEWNPFVLIKLIVLKNRCKKSQSKLILSLHEYKRVSRLRRYFTDLILSLVDGIMVTDEETSTILKKYNKDILLRNIPSNIPLCNDINIKKEKNVFCYFGLVNKSKSFDLMIEAWKIFNKEKKYKLKIYTSTDINIEEMEKYNIEYFKELDDENLSIELSKAMYAILPINPYIGLNNGSLKAVTQHKCIPIGRFETKDLELLGIEINNKYTLDNLIEAFDRAVNLTEEKYKYKINYMKIFSEKFSFKNNANDMIEFIKNI